MLSEKPIFFSSPETLPANNKDIQIYAEKQDKHSTFSSLLVWKKCLHKLYCGKKFLHKFEATSLLTRFLLFNIFL